MTVKAKLMAVSGAAGAILSQLFGGFTSDLKTLLILMAADLITGMIVAGVFKNSAKSPGGALESKAGWKGISKKAVTLFFVIISRRMDILFDTDFIKTAVVAAYSVNEIVSLTENAGLMGIPIPQPIKKAIDVLKSNSGES